MGQLVINLEQCISKVKTLKFKFQLIDPNPSDLIIIRFIDRTSDCCKSLRRMVISGEMLIELGDSWFLTKTMVVVFL